MCPTLCEHYPWSCSSATEWDAKVHRALNEDPAAAARFRARLASETAAATMRVVAEEVDRIAAAKGKDGAAAPSARAAATAGRNWFADIGRRF